MTKPRDEYLHHRQPDIGTCLVKDERLKPACSSCLDTMLDGVQQIVPSPER